MKLIKEKSFARPARCFLLVFLLSIIAMPVQQSYAYSNVDDAISWAEDEIGSNWDASCKRKWALWCMHFVGHCYDKVPAEMDAIQGWTYSGFGPQQSSFPPPRGGCD